MQHIILRSAGILLCGCIMTLVSGFREQAISDSGETESRLNPACSTTPSKRLYQTRDERTVSLKNSRFVAGQAVFQENKGQFVDTGGKACPGILYCAQVANAQIYLRRDGISTVFTKIHGGLPISPTENPMQCNAREHATTTLETYRIDMTLLGCNQSASVRPEEMVDGTVNFYLAHCESGIHGVREYRKIIYENIYDHIDLELITGNGKMKYNFLVHPGGNPRMIRMKYDHVAAMDIEDDGALAIRSPIGMLKEATPYTYTMNDHLPVACDYRVNGGIVTFSVDSYDKRNTLIIDPWATYYGGSAYDICQDVQLDGSGNLYVSGNAWSTTGIATSGAHQTTLSGSSCYDAFLVKFNANGSRQWATYYGGSGWDAALSLAVSASGDVHVAGNTESASGIATTGTHDNTYNGNRDIFVAKFNASGVRQWGTYYGGTGTDSGYGVTVDASGNVYCAGLTTSTNGVATTGSHDDSHNGGEDGCIAKFSNTGVLQWATYYGGSGIDHILDLVSDGSSNLYAVGLTTSSSPANCIATTGVHQSTSGGHVDAFVVKMSSSGSRVWGTYYGGINGDWGHDIALDGNGYLYITGHTTSSGGIATANTHDQTFNGNFDTFVAKLSVQAVRQWGTYIGGGSHDESWAIATDGVGNVYVTGYTASTSGIASTGAYQSTFAGGTYDAFLVKLNATGNRVWGTYYGGSGKDLGSMGLTADANGNVYFAGYTESSSGIATTGAHQSTYGGSGDGYIVQLNTDPTDLSWNGNVNTSWSTAGNWDNPYACPDAGDEVTIPSTTSPPASIPAISLSKLIYDNSTGTTLAGALGITNQLSITGGSISLSNYDLTLSSSATLTTATGGKIVTDGTGALVIKDIGPGGKTGDVLFPIGPSTSTYAPVTVKNTGTTDDLSVRVSAGVLSAGTGGTAITSDVVNHTWHVGESTPGGSQLEMTLQWDGATELTGFGRTVSFIAHHTGSEWEQVALLNAAVGSNPYTLSANEISDLSPFIVADPHANLGFSGPYIGAGSSGYDMAESLPGYVPVELSTFSVREKDGIAFLQWRTETELNNYGFEIQRGGSLSDDALLKIGFVEGAGSSQIPRIYQFRDRLGDETRIWYRLKQIDRDGSHTFSPVICLERGMIPTRPEIAGVYPQPVRSAAMLELILPDDTPLEIHVINLMGEIVCVPHTDPSCEKGRHVFPLRFDGLPAGTYFLRVMTPERVLNKTLQVM